MRRSAIPRTLRSGSFLPRASNARWSGTVRGGAAGFTAANIAAIKAGILDDINASHPVAQVIGSGGFFDNGVLYIPNRGPGIQLLPGDAVDGQVAMHAVLTAGALDLRAPEGRGRELLHVEEVGRAKVRVPLGVIGFIYESRPNVTADAAGLCIKSGNEVDLVKPCQHVPRKGNIAWIESFQTDKYTDHHE